MTKTSGLFDSKETLMGASYEEVETAITPLMETLTLSSHKQMGMDAEDLRQELRIVLWKCINAWEPGEPGDGKKWTAFMPFFKRSAINRIYNLKQLVPKQSRNVEELECRKCGEHIPNNNTYNHVKCDCGNTTWKPVFANKFGSLDLMFVNDDDGGEFSHQFEDPSQVLEDIADAHSYASEVIAAMPDGAVDTLRRVLRGESVEDEERHNYTLAIRNAQKAVS